MATIYNFKRSGARWTINECLRLEKEYESLELSIDEIAARHQRTPNAIMFKLDEEKIADYTTLYNRYYNLNQTNDNQEEEEEEEATGEQDDSSDYEELDNDESGDDDDEPTNNDLAHRVSMLEKQISKLVNLIETQNSKKGVSSWFS